MTDKSRGINSPGPFPAVPSGSQFRLPTVLADLITHPLLTSFPFSSHSLTPLLMFPGISSQINYLHLNLLSQGLLRGEPKPRHFIITLVCTQIICQHTRMRPPIHLYMNTHIYTPSYAYMGVSHILPRSGTSL